MTGSDVSTGRILKVEIIGLAALAVVSAGAFLMWQHRPGIGNVETTQASFPNSVAAIDVDLDSGSLSVVAGDVGEVSIERRLEWRHNKPVLTEAWVGATLRITGRCADESGCESNVTLRVPTADTVRVRVDAGDVSLRFDQAPRKVTAELAAGNIEVRAPGAGSIDARSDAGDVSVRLTDSPGRVAATSMAGDVEVLVPRLAAGAGYAVAARTEAGTRNVDVELDPAGPSVLASTGAGDVSVGYVGL